MRRCIRKPPALFVSEPTVSFFALFLLSIQICLMQLQTEFQIHRTVMRCDFRSVSSTHTIDKILISASNASLQRSRKLSWHCCLRECRDSVFARNIKLLLHFLYLGLRPRAHRKHLGIGIAYKVSDMHFPIIPMPTTLNVIFFMSFSPNSQVFLFVQPIEARKYRTMFDPEKHYTVLLNHYRNMLFFISKNRSKTL